MSSALAKTDYALLSYELDEAGRMFLHLDLQEFTLSVARRIRADFEEVMTFVSSKGYEDVYVLIPDNDPLLEKFERWFGFERIGHTNHILILSRETRNGN